MKRESDRKIILVTRPTRLDLLIRRFNTEYQAKFYVEHMGGDFADYQSENANYYQALDTTRRTCEKAGIVHELDWTFLSSFIFSPNDIVLALGQDGLIANTMKYLNGQPLIGVNPDVSRWEGVLLPYQPENCGAALRSCIAGNAALREITMASVSLNDGQKLYAVNDFFLGINSHASARYIISHRGISERHSSCGIVVSTGLGSTGWLRSLYAGAMGLMKSLSPENDFQAPQPLPWNAKKLFYTVREPFPASGNAVNMVHGVIEGSFPLEVKSIMSENGIIFSDGIQSDYLQFNAGTVATFSVADRRGSLVHPGNRT